MDIGQLVKECKGVSLGMEGEALGMILEESGEDRDTLIR
jgi:hypothetical protein